MADAAFEALKWWDLVGTSEERAKLHHAMRHAATLVEGATKGATLRVDGDDPDDTDWPPCRCCHIRQPPRLSPEPNRHLDGCVVPALRKAAGALLHGTSLKDVGMTLPEHWTLPKGAMEA